MMQDNTGLLPIVNAIIWLRKRKLGLSFLLALLSWLVLSLLWQVTEVGSASFKLIAAIMRPGFAAGRYLAGIFPGNDASLSFAALLMVWGSLILMYTAFWYAVISAVRGMWSDKPSDSDESHPAL